MEDLESVSTQPRFRRSFEESIVLTLFDLVNHLTKSGERMSREIGLTVKEWILLLQVAGDPNFPAPDAADRGSTTASTIAGTRGVSRAHISSLVAALVRKGMLQQIPGSQDRRWKHLRLTPAGAAALARIEPKRHRANQALFTGCSSEQLSGILEGLQDSLTRLCRSSATLGTPEVWRSHPLRGVAAVSSAEEHGTKVL